ncbi:SET domain-containing protein 5 [Hypsizygus marmoreus]|uniref:SET domain-containing protein 5 n=1 Tax=Hypsizygus marmoreus TaxID=39966 RepID=A0A369K6A0_HYPMA|nr:SET domain-containing protein 5 [Hypsizygus marmoreus]
MMKRGFLNTKKAARSAERHAPDPLPSKLQPAQANFPIAEVERALPEYEVPHIKHAERDPTKKDNSYVFATIPSKESAGTTPAEYSDNVTECLFIGPQPTRAILNTPNFPSHVPRPPMPCHRIGATSTMGLGWFATRDLKMNDVIFAERPLVVTPVRDNRPIGVAQPGMSAEQRQRALGAMEEYEKVLQGVVERMSVENRAALMELANSHTEDGSGPILGVIRTNGFGISFGRKDEVDKDWYSAVHDQLSRINHSCAPNASGHFDLASFSSTVRALRDIKKGDEIFVAYCDQKPTTARQQQLKPYGFTCMCYSCTDPTSDALRERISQSVNHLRVHRTDDAELLKKSIAWMKTIEKAGMQSLMEYGVHIVAAGRAALAMRRRDEYVRYRRMWSDWHEAIDGKPPVRMML